MTDPLSLGLAFGAAVTALVAGWLQWPRPPALDGERWFKVILATLLLGEVEAEDGDEETWAERVLRFVPYHPAGRLPERKVVQPLFDPPGERLEGERALQEKLAGLDELPERWTWMYDDDPAGIEARLSDPFDLGPAYNPAQLVGADEGWEALSRWGAGQTDFREAVLRRLGARWALIEGRPERVAGPPLGDALQAELPELLRLPWAEEGTVEERVEQICTRLATFTPALDDRLVLVAEEAGATLMLRALQAEPGLRDRVVAVLSLGGVIGGRPREQGPYGARDAADWLGRWFTLDHLDSDVVRLTPYFAMQWLDRRAPVPGSAGLPLEAQRFPEPGDDEVIATLESVDLGPLAVHPELPVRQVARALIAVTALWSLTRA